jgi:hypothetical protein
MVMGDGTRAKRRAFLRVIRHIMTGEFFASRRGPCAPQKRPSSSKNE